MDQLKIGKFIAECRKNVGLTQKQLAEQLNLHNVTYLHYEKDQREPPLSVLADMAVFFNVSTDS